MFSGSGSKEEVQQSFRVSVCPSTYSPGDSKCQRVSGFFPTRYLIKILTRVTLFEWRGGQMRYWAEQNICIWMPYTQIIPSWLCICHLWRLFYFSCTPQYELQQKIRRSLLMMLSGEGHSWKHLCQPQTCAVEKVRVPGPGVRRGLKWGSQFKLQLFKWFLHVAQERGDPLRLYTPVSFRGVFWLSCCHP